MIRAESAHIIGAASQLRDSRSAARQRNPAFELSDDALLYGKLAHPSFDPDYEMYTWPDVIDQSQIGAGNLGRAFTDDMEIDDGV
ncbi:MULTISPECIES: hypothetical protein [unclassified Novosphingobium]|uniref:hypothetical protein n=1 Tax=unclassified Novosphingobium TaxID=2644732 RepID=UPI000D4F9B1A|nr:MULTISPECIES: hypothetical protein [unclassified Novosphingobium]PTR05480.1 hypothetical protein C8K11_13211 [Novosphingobium sp. GV055]PUA94038.1 hypothetical protein C8K12_13211 [Novosphingobium sp. GV061]PUB11625.1 hypothetical protein C8K14_13211 [Novosphingobium sp. GV079]PUB37099.1 hypothetical protein C8K10_13211 [Novosphingobium sp. GV027]